MKPIPLNPPFPDHVLLMLDPVERQKLGKDFRTMNEIQSDGKYQYERDLHKEIRTLLNLKGIVYLEQRMDKKSRGVKGWPDFTFAIALQKPTKHDPVGAVCVPVPIGWEIKLPGKKLSLEQETMFRDMQRSPNAWCCKLIHSLQEAADELKALGI